MPSSSIIEALHVLKDLSAGFVTSRKLPLVNQLGLQRGEEAFHDGVVPAIARPTHGTLDVQVEQPLLVDGRSILAPTIRMVEQPRRHPPVMERHLQRGARQD